MEIKTFSSNAPSHGYTYYHECSGTVTFHDDGQVTVKGHLTTHSGISYELRCNPDVLPARRHGVRDDGSTYAWNDPTELTFKNADAALRFFRNADHNGAGANLRKILRNHN